VAYIHGKGSNLTPGIASDTDRRNYWRNGSADTYGDFVLWSGINAGCAVLVAGYDGTAAFWDASASGAVAQQLNQFIAQNAIPDGQLVLIGHSMGSLVSRWIVNNGVGGAAYYNYNGDYATVARKTRSIISVSGPHLGSPAADAVYGTSDTLCGTFVGIIAGWLGQRTEATYWLTTLQMEYGSASGSWMGDAGRYRTLYTMATRRWDSGNGMLEDTLLSGAWDCLGYVHHWYVPWRSDVPGDGLVFETSGAGQYRESGSSTSSTWGAKSWSNGQWVQGARSDWVRMNHDHEHSRLDDMALTIQDNVRAVTTSYWPGSYIRTNGLALP
jgi:triacylglycerol esterase/lipase EstA (alpha/beta hydrolase family)